MASSVDWNSIPGKDWATLTRGTERKIYVPGVGWQFPATINKERQRRGLPLLKDPGQPAKPTTPPPLPPSSSSQDSQDSSTQSPTPPAPAPAAPKPSPVAAYMKAAADARKSGDPTQMAKARDMGMEIWKSKYKDTLAKNLKTPTTPSMANQAAELRDMQRASQLRQQGQNVMGSNITSVRQDFEKANRPEVLNRPAPAGTALRAQQDMKKNAAIKKEAYDIVLDYLLSEGHAETISEAHYVMMQMDAEHIQNIVEMGDPSFQIKKSSGVGALTPDAAKQLGPKAVELQKKKAASVDLPNLKQSPGSMAQGV